MNKSRNNDPWNNDAIQFPRLLAEIWAVGLTEEQIKDLCVSMDVKPKHIHEIFQRAERHFERLKPSR